MRTLEPLLQHLVPFTLVVFRLAGLLVFTPLLANRSMPRQFRAMLAVMFGVAIYPVLPQAIQIEPTADLASLLPLVVSEALIGVVIGFLAGLPILALDMAGFLMGHQMGLSLGRVYNPDMGSESDAIGQVLMYVALGTFLTLGGLEAAFAALVSTFRNVPIGAFAVDRIPLEAIVGLIGSSFELAVRVAAPVLCIIFLLMIAMGFVMKTMPQINVLSVGFTVKILFGLAMLAVSLSTMQYVTAEEINRVLLLIVDCGQSLT